MNTTQTDAAVSDALRRGGRVDITTRGRKTGAPRRLEIVFHNIDGVLYITGRPGPRGWLANLLAEPRFTLHLKGGVNVDLPATATPISSTT